MKSKLLGLIACMALLGASQAGAATLVGTTSDATGINGLVVDGTTYNVTFVNASYNTVYSSNAPSFLGEPTTGEAAAIALADALNTLGATNDFADSNLFIPYQYVPLPSPSSNLYNVYNSGSASNTAGWDYVIGTDYSVTSYGGTPTDFTVFVAETPVLPALPLFATGLGVIGLLARRRKRKAAALAA